MGKFKFVGDPPLINWRSQYNTAFVDVARRIAKAEPPLWLLVGLTHFSGGIGSKSNTPELRQSMEQITGEMSAAATLLIKWLPIYGSETFGIQCPDDVRIVLGLLPRIKNHLDQLGQPTVGRPKTPNTREVCAAVVVEASQLLHGKVGRRSEELYEVCNDYWRACGGEEIGETGDRSNWRRAVASTTNAEWVRLVLTSMQAEPELQAPLAVQNSI